MIRRNAIWRDMKRLIMRLQRGARSGRARGMWGGWRSWSGLLGLRLIRGLPMGVACLGLVVLAGCSHVLVIPADRVLTRVPQGESFQAPVNGWFMSDAEYQRTERAIEDALQAIRTPKTK